MKEAINEARALIDYSDEELQEYIRLSAVHVHFSYEDLYKEIQRREQHRNTRAMIYLTWAIVVLGTLQVIAMFIALFKHPS